MTTVIVVVAVAMIWLKISHQDRKIASLYANQKRLAARMEQIRLDVPSHARTRQLAEEIAELRAAARQAS